jgi:hypothetical protein
MGCDQRMEPTEAPVSYEHRVEDGTTDGKRKLLRSIARELFQTEVSARLHCRREAARLGDEPPAQPLLATAAHAEHTLRQLPRFAQEHGLPISVFGSVLGAVFSSLRDQLLDRLVCSERSYRGTLLGMRHGVDVVTMLKDVAEQLPDPVLAEWCENWLEARSPLVEHAAEQLQWFASHPQHAIASARPLLHRAHAHALNK